VQHRARIRRAADRPQHRRIDPPTPTVEPPPDAGGASSVAADFSIATLSVLPDVTPVARKIQRQENDDRHPAPTPTPAPPPTPPGDDAEQLKAGGEGSTTLLAPTVSFKVYSGKTLQDLSNALPKEAGSFTFDIAAATAGDPITRATVTVKQAIELPRWAERDVQCRPIQAAWDRFSGALRQHEDEHVKINKQQLGTAHTHYVGKAKSETQDVTTELENDANAAGQAFDTQTGNGTTGNPPTIIDIGTKCTDKGTFDDFGPDGEELQAKLEVSEPGDPDEEEADRVAEQVMRMADPRERAPLRLVSSAGVMRKSSGDRQAVDAPSRVVDVTRTGGQPLDTETRAFMEPRFGHDFSRIRIHSDGEAAIAARSMNARAYTLGSNVVFASGQYAPASIEGRRLLAHELAHTVQQSGGARTGVQRLFGSDSRSNEDKVKDAIRTKSFSDIEAVIDAHALHQVDVATRIDFIWAVLSDSGLHLPDTKGGMVSKIWQSIISTLGKEWWRNLSTSQLHTFSWCVDQSYIYPFIPGDDQFGITEIRQAFRAHVQGLASVYLRDNEKIVVAELDKLGLGEKPDTSEEGKAKQQARLKATQDAAATLRQYRRLQAQLRELPVGYTEAVPHSTPKYSPNPNIQGPEQKEPQANASYSPDVWVLYDPGGPPPVPPKAGQDPPMPKWEDVDASFQKANKVIADILAEFPVLYAAMADDESSGWGDPNNPDAAVGRIARQPEEDARKTVGEALHDVKDRITGTAGKIGTRIKYFDLKPLQEQLYSGTAKANIVAAGLGQEVWTKGSAQWFAKRITKDDDEQNQLEQLLEVTTLLAAAFILGPLVGPELAIVLRAGSYATSAGIAARDWSDYLTKAAAAKTNLTDDTAIMDKGTVNEAKSAAFMSTVFLMLDLFKAARLLKGGGRGAAAAGAVMSDLARARNELAQLSTLKLAEQRAAIEQGVRLLGVEETVRLSKTDIATLISTVGKDTALGIELAAHQSAKAAVLRGELPARRGN